MNIAMKQSIAKDFADKTIAIVGYGLEWRSSVEFLLAIGVEEDAITICDGWDPTLEQNHTGITLISGDEYLDDIGEYDCIIRSAGVSPHQPALACYAEKITNQVELFAKYFPNKTIIITGTKWKSTTTSLIASLLNTAGVSHVLAWNIGTPVLGVLQDIIEEKQHPERYGKDMPDRAVMETSSYQLDGITIHADIWVFTSLYHEHHIKWHGWVQQYFSAKIDAISAAKKKFIAWNIEQADSVLTHKLLYTDPQSISLFWNLWKYWYEDGKFYVNDTVVATDEKMKIPWVHNRYNACAVLWVCDYLSIWFDVFEKTLEDFTWLPHRLEFVWNHQWINRYNDAISTTPESTIAAIQALWNDIKTIFLGWVDGGYDFTTLAQVIHASAIENIVLFPENHTKIQEAIGAWYTYHYTESMEDAIMFAAKNTQQNAIALLSCASPSYTLWTNFIEKWNLFKQIASWLKG